MIKAILVILNIATGHVATAEFNNIDACFKASETVKNMSLYGGVLRTRCVLKGKEE